MRFAYRTSRGVESERHVDPWGLVFRAGHWYLVGMDREREEIRAFRLSRAGGELRLDGEAGPPPEGFRAAEHVQGGPFGPGEPEERATVSFSPEVAWWATRGVQGAVVQETRPDGWVQVSLPAAPGDALVSWILSFGPDAVAVAVSAADFPAAAASSLAKCCASMWTTRCSMITKSIPTSSTIWHRNIGSVAQVVRARP